MRDILFRGKAGPIWVAGYLLVWPSGQMEICAQTPGEEAQMDKMTVKPETVGQFTGRTDKNGKEVFEHDILQLYRVWEDGTVDKYAVAVVLFSTHDQAYVLCCGNDLNVRYDDFGNYGNPEYYEVIGNIHDNDLGDFNGN